MGRRAAARGLPSALPEEGPYVGIYHLDQCDPKKCTGTRLGRLGLAEVFYNLRGTPYGALLLDPSSEVLLSAADAAAIEEHGIVAFDCSWRQFSQSLRLLRRPRVVGRALPYLLAANAVNYGKPLRLTTAEALIASLIIVGQENAALRLARPFPWAQTFLDLNAHLLEAYAEATGPEEVEAAQLALMPPKHAQQLLTRPGAPDSLAPALSSRDHRSGVSEGEARGQIAPSLGEGRQRRRRMAKHRRMVRKRREREAIIAALRRHGLESNSTPDPLEEE